MASSPTNPSPGQQPEDIDAPEQKIPTSLEEALEVIAKLREVQAEFTAFKEKVERERAANMQIIGMTERCNNRIIADLSGDRKHYMAEAKEWKDRFAELCRKTGNERPWL